MKQLLILSGKGGTGKTTVAGAFIRLAEARAFADCDVDAPNLHLIMQQGSEPRRSDYHGLPKAVIDPDICIQCDLCRQHCRFSAITVDEHYFVDPFACEGCSVCKEVCPVDAIQLVPSVDGELRLYQNVDSVFSTAQLKMGSGTSGMLVSEVKKQLRTAGVPAELAIIDGSPGIGCPVIASVSGVDMVLLVAEPSISGVSDLERVYKTVRSFQVPAAVCINKADTNPEQAERIKDFCLQEGIELAGSIPFDPQAVAAINAGLTIAEVDCPSGQAVKKIFERTMQFLDELDNEDAR